MTTPAPELTALAEALQDVPPIGLAHLAGTARNAQRHAERHAMHPATVAAFDAFRTLALAVGEARGVDFDAMSAWSAQRRQDRADGLPVPPIPTGHDQPWEDPA